MLESISNPELWAEGLSTMIVGMGIVFAFLVILVISINIMTRVVAQLNIWFPLPVEAPKASKKAKSDDSEVAIAIDVAAAQK